MPLLGLYTPPRAGRVALTGGAGAHDRTHTLSRRAPSPPIPAVWTVTASGLTSFRTLPGVLHTSVLCGLRCDTNNKPIPWDATRYTNITRPRRSSSSECRMSPMLSTPLSEGVMDVRACPLAPPGCTTRWGATSCRSKAALLTDRMRWR